MIVTFFGSGYSPVAPGTAGSLLISIFLYLLLLLDPAWWQFQAALMAVLLLASVGSVLLGAWAVEHFGRKDPGAFVLDEVAGIAFTNLLLPISPHLHTALTPLLAFAFFRLFDVTKPPPARQLEKLPAGWGILLDDLAAAFYANLVCHILLRWMQR